MTDPVIVLVAERVIERSIIAIFAGVSLVLGYSLFKAGIITQQQGEGEWGKLKIKLLSVGPGVFFALFGTIVMIILVVHGLTIPAERGDIVASSVQRTDALPLPTSKAPSISYGADAGKFDLSTVSPEDVMAVNTVLDIVETGESKLALAPAQADALEKGLKGLDRIRRAAAFRRFPRIASKYSDWSDRASTNPRFIDSLSPEDKKDFREMSDFLNSSYLSGGK